MVCRGKSKRRDLHFQGIIRKCAPEEERSTMEKKNGGRMKYRWQKRAKRGINEKIYRHGKRGA